MSHSECYSWYCVSTPVTNYAVGALKWRIETLCVERHWEWLWSPKHETASCGVVWFETEHSSVCVSTETDEGTTERHSCLICLIFVASSSLTRWFLKIDFQARNAKIEVIDFSSLGENSFLFLFFCFLTPVSHSWFLGCDVKSKIVIQQLNELSKRRQCQMLTSVDELVSVLQSQSVLSTKWYERCPKGLGQPLLSITQALVALQPRLLAPNSLLSFLSTLVFRSL